MLSFSNTAWLSSLITVDTSRAFTGVCDDLKVSVLAKDGGETQCKELRLCFTLLAEYESDCAE